MAIRPRTTGYGSGYSNYRYQQTPSIQYQSFFDPIPLDFLQAQFDRRQSAYDQAFAGALAAKEAALQQEIALGDQVYRNELIQQSMQDMDRITQEKYGGDYGRAAKDIARMVTDLRSNPLWKSSKHLKEQQALQQKFMLENPDAHLYTDVMKIGAYDPELGAIRTPEQLTFEAEKHGDWEKSVELQFADLKGNIDAVTLDSIGIPGYKGIMHISELEHEDIDKLLEAKPEMVRAFLENNPDFARSKARIDKLDEDQIFQKAKDYIIGHISDKPFREEKLQAVTDWVYKNELERAAKNMYESPWGDTQASERFNTGFNADPSRRKERINLGFFNEDGSFMGDEEYRKSIQGYIPGQTGRTPGLASAIVGSVRKGIADRKMKAREQDRKDTIELINDLRENNPDEFKGLTDIEVFNKFNENMDAYDFSVNYSKPLFNEDYSINIGQAVNNNISGTDFYMKGDDRSGATKYQGKGGIEERTGIPLPVFEDMLINPEYGKGYDQTEGTYYIEVPNFTDGITLNTDGSINWTKSPVDKNNDTKRVYFHPDDFTSRANQAISGLNEAFKTGNDELLELTVANYDPSGSTVIDKEALKKARRDPKVDVNEAKVIEMPLKDESGYPTGKTGMFSLNDLRRNYFIAQTQRLSTYYFKRD